MSRHYFYIHTVVAVRSRRRVLAPRLDGIVRRVASEVAEDNTATLVAYGAAWDHCHLFHRISSGTLVKRLLGQTKTCSTYALRAAGLPDFEWQTGTWSETVGRAGVYRVVAYVENQRERHAAKQIKLEDEIRELEEG